MKKAVPIFLILVAVIYSFFWWKQANRLKNEVVAFAKEAGVEFESVSLKGFPFKFAVEVKNPGPDRSSFQGTIVVGTDLFARNGTVRIDGESASSDYLVKGNLTLTKPHFLEALNKRKKGEDSPVDWLKDLTVSSNGLIVQQGERVLYKMERGCMKLGSVESTSKGIQSAVALELLGLSRDSLFKDSEPVNYIDIRLRANFACPPFGVGFNFSPLSVQIDEFYSSNLYTQSTAKGRVDFEQSEGEFFLHVDYSDVLQILRPFPSLDKEKVFAALEHVASYDPLTPIFLQNHWDDIAVSVPDYLSHGTIHFDIDADFKETSGQNSLTVRKLDFHSDLYGIEVKAAVAPSQTVDFALHLDNHRDLIFDLLHYYNRIQPLLTKPDLLGEGSLPLISDSLGEKIVGFIESISERSADNAISLAVKVDQVGNITVGTQPIEKIEQDLMALASEIILESEVKPSAENVLIGPEAI